jgi:hypothetical protein
MYAAYDYKGDIVADSVFLLEAAAVELMIFGST